MGSRQITYAANGNILSIDGVGDLMYDGPISPYRLGALTPEGETMSLVEPRQNVIYNNAEHPESISQNGITASLTYNGSDDRVKMTITHVATVGGTLVAEYSYDPWGRLRDPETLAIYSADNTPDLILGRGFTGHEHLPWFGLVNMNARLYDPLVGLFLSHDPYVQAPDFTQNYNRYSYCLNNPLKYTDERGEFLTWNISLQGLSIGINLTTIGIPLGVGINVGWGNGLSTGVYGEIGYRVGSFGITANCSYDYNYALKISAFSFGAGAYFNAGVFSANASLSYSNGHLGWYVGAGFGVGDSISGYGAFVNYGSAGFNVGLGGYYDWSKAYTFRKGYEQLGIGDGTSLDPTDETLLRCQQERYPDAPMDNIKIFTVENVPEARLALMKKNSANALTIPYYLNGKVTGKSSVYFRQEAFLSARTLYSTMGHEFVHVCNYITAANYGYTKTNVRDPMFIELTEFWAYSYESSVKQTYNSFNQAAIMNYYGYDTFTSFSYFNMSWYTTRNKSFDK